MKEIVTILVLAGAAHCWGSRRLEGIFTFVARIGKKYCILKMKVVLITMSEST